MALAGLNLLDSGNNQITADEDGNYYSSSAILKFDGKTKISLSQWGVGKTQLNLTETTIISSVYKGGIIGRKQISLNPSVKIVIDTTKPKIELSDDEKTIWKTEADTTVDITGTAVDENLKKVVWSETELTPDDVLNGAQEAALNENGKFELNQSGLVAYSHGEYYGLGERVGTFGYSVRKKKDTCGRKRRKNYSGKNSN